MHEFKKLLKIAIWEDKGDNFSSILSVRNSKNIFYKKMPIPCPLSRVKTLKAMCNLYPSKCMHKKATNHTMGVNSEKHLGVWQVKTLGKIENVKLIIASDFHQLVNVTETHQTHSFPYFYIHLSIFLLRVSLFVLYNFSYSSDCKVESFLTSFFWKGWKMKKVWSQKFLN